MVTPLAILSPPQILPFTFVIFIFVQSYILSIKFSKAYETADRLSRDLQKEVEIQTKEVVEAKNRAEESEKEVANLIHNMKQSVFTIDASGSIFPPVSEYSKELFGENIEGKHVYGTLFKNMDKKGEDFSYIDTSLSVIFDSDDLQWNLVREYFPHKINYRFNDESDFKILRISYTPLWDQKELLEKLMFVIEDITELENLENKMKNQEEEAGKRALIIQELAASKKEEIHQFFNSILVLSHDTISFWKNLREEVKKGKTHFELEILFRNLHTIKGNARIFGMTLISKSAHDVETIVDIFRNFEFKKDELEPINLFLENLYDLQAQINEYLDQARDLFGFELEEDKNSKMELHELLKEFDYWFGQFRFMDISMLSLEVGTFIEKIEKLDGDFKHQVFSSLKRIMHSLKGLSRSMNEKEFSKYVHLLEGGITDIEQGILVDQVILEEKLFYPLNKMRSFGRKIFFQSSLFKPLKKTHEIWCSIFKDFFKMCSLWKDINEDNEQELKRALYTINAKTSSHQLYYFPCIIRSTYDYFEDGWANHKDQITFNFQQMALFFKFIFQLDIEKNIFVPIRDSLIVHLKKHRIEQLGDWDKLLKEIYRISQISQDPLLIMAYKNLAKEGVSYYEFKDMLCFLFNESQDNIFEVLIPMNDATPFLNNLFLNLKVDYSIQSFDFVEGLQEKNYETNNTLKSLISPSEVTWYSYLESIDVMRILNNYIDYEDEVLQEGTKPPIIEILSENLYTLQEKIKKEQQGDGFFSRDQMENILNYLIEAPVKYSLKNLKAMVEDIASGLGKKIKFKLTGIEGSLGQKELNLLKDATVHLVRNSVDHGIEMPEDRLNGGKEEIGNLEINFSLDPVNNLKIRIQDDGAGLDPDVICRKAIEKGILDEKEAQELGEQEKINLIFLPGFSTKSSVNELSGRGVGMDVVKTNLEKMGADLKIESRKGEGTAFIVTLSKSFEVEKI
jgi:HPt (histidine-containing phosphotransfer) domain-containing protein